MKRFLGDDFLLETKAGRRLYREYAERMPIYDFHCHLDAGDIAENRRFRSITEAWLGGDHYKWRAMRALGTPERLVTGDAPDEDKFLAWAQTVPSTIGNPLYHWTHLELARYFGIKGRLLGPDTGRAIYAECTSLLSRDEYRVRGLLSRMNVSVVCTTDDPVDTLGHHARLRGETGFPITVVPTFRPDAAFAIDNPKLFKAWTDRLAAAANVDITDWKRFIEALGKRHAFFHENGCRASDFALEVPYDETYAESDIERIFKDARIGRIPDPAEVRVFKSAVLTELCRMNARAGWVQQLHLGALRDINARFKKLLGPNSGFDTIGDAPFARPLARFLDRLDAEGALAKTVLFCLNPADNAVLATMIGNYPGENVRGKMQFGAAWWFNDQKNGMEDQMRMLSDMGLLPAFIGMVTDSRSFLSYPRHEYFRRILCSMLGAGIERGEIPADYGLVGGIVRDICFNNAAAYFNVPRKQAG